MNQIIFEHMVFQMAQFSKNEQSQKWESIISFFVHNSFNFKTRPALSITSEYVESVTLEIIFEKTLYYTKYHTQSTLWIFGTFSNLLNNLFLERKKTVTKIFILQKISILTFCTYDIMIYL